MDLIIGVALGAAIGLISVPYIVEILHDAAPLPDPPAVFPMEESSHDALFRPRPWMRVREPIARNVRPGPPPAPENMPEQHHGQHDEFRDELQPEAPAYNRPLDVQAVPDDGIMPPPRRVRGRNREM